MPHTSSKITDFHYALELRNITKSYDGVTTALHPFTMGLRAGEFLAIIGGSGSGKTTLLKILMGLITPSAGEVFIEDKPASSYPINALKRKFGYVFQHAGLLPHMSILDNITLVPYLEKVPEADRRDLALRLLDTVQLPCDYLTRFPAELSGGEQQRINIARALATDPDFILMDEPFASLDSLTRQQLQDEVLHLKEKLKKTIIFITHDIQEALLLADKVAIMNDGKLVQVDTPEGLQKTKNAHYVDQLLGASNAVQSEVA